ncbi:MAG: hypothetical protein GYB68_00225 [Chloroflexi bacterium]|nr:hypothetical protein [Chloroflexota bacterium]
MATTFTPSETLQRWRLSLPLSRDQVMLLMIAINLLFLGIDTYLAHIISGTIVPNEWIPIIFGFVSGVILLVAGLIALRFRMLANILATITLSASIVVGLLGTYFHVARAALPFAPVGERLTTPLLVWAPPVVGPLAFVFVGLLGISAAWVESPVDSGQLILPGGSKLRLPYSKARAYFYTVGMGVLISLISAVLDHGRVGYSEIALWIPIVTGVFGAVSAVMMGALDDPTPFDVMTYIAAMVLLILTGLVGTYFHISADLSLGGGQFVLERFIRGAPVLAPLLFANMGMIGLIVLIKPADRTSPEA